MMIKRYLTIIVALLFVVCSGIAQQTSNQVYAISYINESHLMQRMNLLTLVDFKMEWPERLCCSDVPVLKKELCKLLFDKESTSIRQCINDFLADKGKELKSKPNSKGLKTTYVNISLSELAFQMDKYISFQLVKSVRYEESLEPYISETYLLTYDMLNDKVLRTKDILRPEFLKNSYNSRYIWELIINRYEVINAEMMLDEIPSESCLTPDGLVVNIPYSATDNEGDLLVLIPHNESYDCYRNKVKKWLRKSVVKSRNSEEVESEVIEISNMNTVDTTKVYAATPTMPEYEGGTKAMMNDIVKWINYPKYEMGRNIQGKVVVSFIVGKDGKVSSPQVISPLSPGIDREAVKAVMSLAKWTPGAFGDIMVDVKMAVPVIFKVSR